MKKLFTIFSLTLLLTLVQSNSVIALTELPTAKCNKKCQEEKKANKSTCALFLTTNSKFVKAVEDRSANRITREFYKNEILNISTLINTKTSSKTRDDLEVYMKEYAYWLTFLAMNVLPENITNQRNASVELSTRWTRIRDICK
jgi:hypothetical protein